MISINFKNIICEKVNKDKQSGEKDTKSHKNDQQRLTLLLQQVSYIYSVNSM